MIKKLLLALLTLGLVGTGTQAFAQINSDQRMRGDAAFDSNNSLDIEAARRSVNMELLVDEIENGLGVNCMPEVTEALRLRTDLQFILTSHHPYIINNLPTRAWKLVRRQGTQVRIDPASEFAGIDTSSHHRAFTQLINLPEFEDGIS